MQFISPVTADDSTATERMMTDYAIALSYPQPDSSIDSCVSLNAHARGLHIILAIRLKRVWGKN